LDGGELYTENVCLNDIYNFVVQIVFIQIHFGAQMINTMFIFKIQNLDLDSLLNIWATRWLQMKKVELRSCRSRQNPQSSYKLISIRVRTQKLQFFENVLGPTAVWNGGNYYSSGAPSARGSKPYRRFPRQQ
jgi:hypothetical protein